MCRDLPTNSELLKVLMELLFTQNGFWTSTHIVFQHWWHVPLSIVLMTWWHGQLRVGNGMFDSILEDDLAPILESVDLWEW
jgi:hypothetical protein